jgi:DNA-binding NarL/FixJ family response regulator
MKFKVLVADDHVSIRDGLKKILADTDDLIVEGEAGNSDAVLEKVRERDWNLVVLDLSMPGQNGLDLIRLIKNERPNLPILIFSLHQEALYAVRAIRAGASGYLCKDDDSELLLLAMRKLVAGGVFVSPALAKLLTIDALPKTQAPNT